VFENRVLRRIFGPKRDVTEGLRKLHNEESWKVTGLSLDEVEFFHLT
jgi:hypothetical protein